MSNNTIDKCFCCRVFRQVVETVEAVTGKEVPVRLAPRRAGDPPELVADPSRAFDRLGWRARHFGLKNIVQTAWRWLSASR